MKVRGTARGNTIAKELGGRGCTAAMDPGQIRG